MSESARTRARAAAVIAAGWGLAQFVTTALVLQFIRRNLDPWTSTLSRYLVGPGGGWLVAAYLVLALGLGLFGIFVEEDRDRPELGRLAFVLAGLGLATAGLVTPPAHVEGLMGEILLRVHLLGAGVAFLALTVVALRSSWMEQGPFPAGGMRRVARLLSTLAGALVVAYALISPKSGGRYEKVLIILLVLWMALRWTVSLGRLREGHG